MVCASCGNGWIPVRRFNIAGQVFIGVGALALLGVFRMDATGGFFGTLVVALLAWWFLRSYGSEIRCGKCGGIAVERARAIRGLLVEREEEVARIQRERVTERVREKERNKIRDAFADEVEKELGSRALWVRRGSCEDSEDALSITTELPARQMEPVVIARGIVTRARAAGYEAIVIHGSMNRAEYARLERELGGKDEADILAELTAMEEADMIAIPIQRDRADDFRLEQRLLEAAEAERQRAARAAREDAKKQGAATVARKGRELHGGTALDAKIADAASKLKTRPCPDCGRPMTVGETGSFYCTPCSRYIAT